MKIAIGSDHGGFNLKAEIINFLKQNEYEFEDFGTFTKESVDYVDYAKKVAMAVQGLEYERGILVCGTGIGISIAANKFPGIRASVCTDSYTARMTRLHNDSNILALGERVLGIGSALDIVETWLKTDFEGGRHQLRVDKITEIEKNIINKE